MTHTVRRITDDEVDAYTDHGWVHLPGLVPIGQVALLRERALARLAARTTSEDPQSPVDRAFGQDRDIAEVDEDFRRLAHDPQMARNALRLIGTARRVRLQITNLLIKEPRGRGRHSGATMFHQDFPWMPMDRSSMLTVWVALAPVPAAMGSLRFHDRSHRRGLLGRSFVREGDDMHSQHPWLDELPVVGGLDMAPGDATVHHALTVHGAAENTCASTRLSFTATYFDADTLYTGAPYGQTDGLSEPLRLNEPFDHPKFPLIPTGRRAN